MNYLWIISNYSWIIKFMFEIFVFFGTSDFNFRFLNIVLVVFKQQKYSLTSAISILNQYQIKTKYSLTRVISSFTTAIESF